MQMPENAKHVQGYKVIHPPALSVNLSSAAVFNNISYNSQN